jgi:hypothetical protein
MHLTLQHAHRGVVLVRLRALHLLDAAPAATGLTAEGVARMRGG